MGSLRPNKLQAISLSGSTLTLPGSPTAPTIATVGGQSYRITSTLSLTLAGMTAGSLYYIYLIPSGSTLVLTSSVNAPSVGVGSAGSLLVGGVIADAATTGAAIKDVYGSPITNLKSYVPISSWTGNVNAPTGFWKQVGDELIGEVRQSYTGAPTGTNLDFSIPSGFVIDTTKITEATGNLGVLGQVDLYIGSANAVAGVVSYASTTTLRMYYYTTGSTPTNSTTLSPISPTAPGTWATSGQIIARFRVPIVGFASTPLINN